ncbi:hypothetical protein U1Q18_003801 [Sarracenia purpurea var. burkii]
MFQVKLRSVSSSHRVELHLSRPDQTNRTRRPPAHISLSSNAVPTLAKVAQPLHRAEQLSSACPSAEQCEPLRAMESFRWS